MMWYCHSIQSLYMVIRMHIINLDSFTIDFDSCWDFFKFSNHCDILNGKVIYTHVFYWLTQPNCLLAQLWFLVWISSTKVHARKESERGLKIVIIRSMQFNASRSTLLSRLWLPTPQINLTVNNREMNILEPLCNIPNVPII